MSTVHKGLIAVACLILSASFACRRGADGSKAPSGEGRTVVGDDLEQVGKATKKVAKDIGQATTEAADKAGDKLEEAANKAAAGGQDAWLTTKVKSALTSEGLDALHVHVDTKDKIVTLSGNVDSAANKAKAVRVARDVTGVLDVKDHLFVGHDAR
ncbi:MAG TPA: BON domain-containing protein [Polyangia bacterium]